MRADEVITVRPWDKDISDDDLAVNAAFTAREAAGATVEARPPPRGSLVRLSFEPRRGEP